MTKIDIFSGFLGAGKTTLLKKLIAEAYCGQKLVLIENEFGEIGIDGGFMQDAGINVTEMNSGCICCSLVGDFGKALQKVLDEYHPDRILIEPSGVGKLSDVIRAVQKVESDDCRLNAYTTVVDANKCRLYMKNFGEFFDNQIEYAGSVILSHTDGMTDAKLAACVELIRSLNDQAAIVTTSWNEITGAQILDVIEHRDTLHDQLESLVAQQYAGHDEDEDEHEHHHHHHDHDEDGEHACCCGHHHDDDDDDDDDEDSCGCGHHHHGHEGHHHADEVFTSWGRETAKKFSADALREMLEALDDDKTYGVILRAKGIVAGDDGRWIHFDYVPGTPDVRYGSAGATGRLCVIGSHINEEALSTLFGL